MPPSVTRTADFERIAALPRRTLDRETAAVWASEFTARYARPGSGAALLPWQGQALVEIVQCGGAFLGLPVGIGKTHIFEVAPSVLRSEVSVLIVPAALRPKTFAARREIRAAWSLPSQPSHVLSREELALETRADLLTKLAPDLILIDECHALANTSTATVRRLNRYLASDPACRVVVGTGTPSRKSIMGYWHLLRWALGDGAPVPLARGEAELWAGVLDDSPRCAIRPRPGPLGATVEAAVAWYRDRLRETPGVLIVDEDSAGDVPITVRQLVAPQDSALDVAFAKLGLDQENPGGIPITDSLSRWLLDGQLGLGLYTRWCPPPPERWRTARRAVAAFVRDRIAQTTNAHAPLDTEAQVLRRHAGHPVVAEWLAVKGTYREQTEAVWLSDSTLRACEAWLADVRCGVVWTGSLDFGRELARRAGLAFYEQGGEARDGRSLLHAPPGRSFVASWKANAKGFNLQAWPRQLVTMPPQSALDLEQLLGRAHRTGQTERVTIEILVTSGGTADAFEAALREARKVRDREGLTQKLLRADVERAAPRRTAANRYRWARKESETTP